jgi:predicted metal-dependent hydrolase
MLSANKIIRTKRKTIALIVQADGTLLVRAPKHAPKREINALIKKHAAWIEKKQAEARKNQKAFAPKKFIEGEFFFFLGEKYPLHFVEKAKKKLFLDSDFQMRRSAQNNAAQIFEQWYKKEARQIFNERVGFYAKKYDFSYEKLKLSSAKRRWGSCSERGNINLTWRLVMMPPEIIDYVIVHELCHLREQNHSKAFWTQVKGILSDYKQRRKWLRENGQKFHFP